MPTFIERNLPGERGIIAKTLGQAGLITFRFYPTVVSFQAREYWRSQTGRDFDREANYRARDDPMGPQQVELYCAEGKQVQNAHGQSFVDLDVTGVKHGRLAFMMCNYLRLNPACRGAEFEVQVDGVVAIRQNFARRQLEEKRVFLTPQLQIRRETGEITVSFNAFPKEDSCPPRLAFVMKYSRDRMAEHPQKDRFASRRLIWGEREVQRERSIAEQPPPTGVAKRRDRSPVSRNRASSRYESKRSRRSYDRYDRERDRDRDRERDHNRDRVGKSSRHDDDDDEDRYRRSRGWNKSSTKESEADAEIRKAIELAFTPPESSDGHKTLDQAGRAAEGCKSPRNSASVKSRKDSNDLGNPGGDPRALTDPRLRAYSPVSTLSDKFDDVQDPLKLAKPEEGVPVLSPAPQANLQQANYTKMETMQDSLSVPTPSATELAPLGSPVGLNELQARNSALETEMRRLRLLCDNRRLQREVEMLRRELESGKKGTGTALPTSAAVTTEAPHTPLHLTTSPSEFKPQEQNDAKLPSPSAGRRGSSIALSERNDGATDATTASASQSPVTSIGSVYCPATNLEVDQNFMRIGALLDSPLELGTKEYFNGPASAPALGRANSA